MTRRLSFLLLLLLLRSPRRSRCRRAAGGRRARRRTSCASTRAPGSRTASRTLTTVIEVVQFKPPVARCSQPCAGVTGGGDARLLERRAREAGRALGPVPVPRGERAPAREGRPARTRSTKFVDKTQWGKAQGQPDVGHGVARLGRRLERDGRPLRRRARHRARAHRGDAAERPDGPHVLRRRAGRQRHEVEDVQAAREPRRTRSTSSSRPMPSHGSDRALFSQIKTMTQDGVRLARQLRRARRGAAAPGDGRPLERRGPRRPGERVARAPTSSTSTSTAGASRRRTRRSRRRRCRSSRSGSRTASSLVENIYRNNEAQFMQSLANPEIGGFFDIVKEGEGDGEGQDDHRPRAARASTRCGSSTGSCPASTRASSRRSTSSSRTRTPPSRPTGRSRTCPLGVDPTQWPLDVDVKKTTEAAAQNPLYPGGTFNVYGNFCWGGDKTRAEAYFIPAGTKPNANANSRDPHVALQAMQQLQAEHMLGTAVSTRRRLRDVQRARRREGPRGHGRQRGRAPRRLRQQGAPRVGDRREVGADAQGARRSRCRARSSRASRGSPSSSCCSSWCSCAAAGAGEKRGGGPPPPAQAPPRLRHARRGAATARLLLRAAATGCSSSAFAADPLAARPRRRAAAARWRWPPPPAQPLFAASAQPPPQVATPFSPPQDPACELGSGGAAAGRPGALPGVRDEHDGDARPAVRLLLVRAAAAGGDDEGRWGRRCPRVSPHRRHERAAARRPAEPLRSAAGRVAARSAATHPRRRPGSSPCAPGSEVRVGRDPGAVPHLPQRAARERRARDAASSRAVSSRSATRRRTTGPACGRAHRAGRLDAGAGRALRCASAPSSSPCSSRPDPTGDGDAAGRPTLPAVEYAERSDPGRDPDKQVNEDACGHRETRFGHLCVVCDGMGGHAAGREAAELAVATIFEVFERRRGRDAAGPASSRRPSRRRAGAST